MHKLVLTSLAAGMVMLTPVMAQTVPAASGDKEIVIAQREGGGGGGGGGGAMKGGGGGGGGGGAMKGGGGGGGVMKGGGGGGGGAMKGGDGGGGGNAMRGPSQSRSVDRAGPRGGDGAGRALRNRGNADGERVLRGDGGGRTVDRGPRRADPGINRGNKRGPGYGYRSGKNSNRSVIRQRGRRYSWGPGIGFYYYGGSYYGDCDWLERRAISTGSAYWWNRYNNCIDW